MRLRRKSPMAEPRENDSFQLGNYLAGDLIVEVRTVGGGMGSIGRDRHRGSPRRAPKALLPLSTRREKPTPSSNSPSGEPLLSRPNEKRRTKRKHRNVRHCDQVSSVLEQVRGPETGSTGRPKEHQHSAAARRDAGPTAPGEGRRIENDRCRCRPSLCFRRSISSTPTRRSISKPSHSYALTAIHRTVWSDPFRLWLIQSRS